MVFPADSNGSHPFFEVFVNGLESEKTYFYRAFAANEEGIAYGAVYRFKTKAIPDYPYWADALPIQDAEGWWSSPWFGSFFMNGDRGWILHAELGWLFILPQDEGLWMWHERLGWLWTEQTIYPFAFSPEWGWVFFHGGNSTDLLLYSFMQERWIQVPKIQ